MLPSRSLVFLFTLSFFRVECFVVQENDAALIAASAQASSSEDKVLSDKLTPSEEKTATYWRNVGQNILKNKLSEKINRNKATNAIFFIGDGMSVGTLMAARTYLGQLNNRPGEEQSLSFEKFPVSGLVKTYCIDAQVADSACSATAYLSGVKTKYGVIGIDGNVIRSNCSTQLDKANHVESIAAWALENGLDAGFVTTTRVTHASPAGTFANIAERNWESDADMAAEDIADGCTDIAFQMINENPGKQFKVIMGGGKRAFLPNITDTTESEPSGRRLDGLDLIASWKSEKESLDASFAYIENKYGLNNLLEAEDECLPEYVLGLFQDDHLDYHLESDAHQPRLEEMVELAIRTLRRNNKGYFLFVEGGRIDHAHHDNFAKLALDETVEFSNAIAKAAEMTSEDDTLLVVSSDHSHTMTVSGYPSRGNDILGVVDTGVASDNVEYTTLSYANGKGYRLFNATRYSVKSDSLFTSGSTDYRYPAMVPLDSETHGGDDVAIFARGPWQHLFTSTFEQNAIPQLIAYAMCIDAEKHEAC